jgi:hypothetical protein
MRRFIVAVGGALIAHVAAARAEAPPVPIVDLGAELRHFSYTPSQGTYPSWEVSSLGADAAVRVDHGTWVTGWMGAAYGRNRYRAGEWRAGNPSLGVRVSPCAGRIDLRVGLDFVFPVASVGTVDGQRIGTQADTYRGAALALGNWDLWRWLPEWTSLLLPARAAFVSDTTRLTLEGAIGLSYSVGGEYADTRSVFIGQLALDVERQLAPHVAVGARGSGVLVRPTDREPDGDRDLTVDGAIEVRATYLTKRGHVDLRIAAPISQLDETDDHDSGLALVLGTRWVLP